MTGKKKYEFRDGEQGAAIAIRVKISLGESRFSQVLKDGTVVVKLNRAEGNLNSRLIEFISSELDLPKAKLHLIAGEDGNKKLISIIDMEPKQIQQRILERIS